MPIGGPGPYQLRVLNARLREAGSEGKGLRRELYKAINEAARPLAAEVGDTGNLRSHMPDRYADVLVGDLSVTAVKRGGRNPGVSVRAKGRRSKRKVVSLDAGVISHPLFGRRDRWFTQSGGMRAGFFTGPAEKAAPEIRRKVLDAMREVGKRITTPLGRRSYG